MARSPRSAAATRSKSRRCAATSTTDGRRATVAFTDDWREDAARRDFTINALSTPTRSPARSSTISAASTTSSARRVRFIGDPLQRIAEDHLRILRFFRFHARFGAGEPDAAARRRLHRARQRSDGAVARAHRRRIAQAARRCPTRRRRSRSCSSAVSWRRSSPRSTPNAAERLEALILAEQAADAGPDPIRRLASLLPRDPFVAHDIAVQAAAVEQGEEEAGQRRHRSARRHPANACLQARRRGCGRPAAACWKRGKRAPDRRAGPRPGCR